LGRPRTLAGSGSWQRSSCKDRLNAMLVREDDLAAPETCRLRLDVCSRVKDERAGLWPRSRL